MKNGGNRRSDMKFKEIIDESFPDFTSFVSGFLNKDRIHEIKIFNPQYIYLYDHYDVLQVDFIARYENLAEDFLEIGRQLHLGDGELPVINPSKYENMTYNSVMLNRHGKFFGLIDGALLGVTLFGAESENAGKGVLVLSIAGSIALGEIGFQLGKKVDWTQGRIAGYTHFAAVTPLVTAGIYASFINVDDTFNERVFSGLILASGAAGYLLGNKLWKKYNYTRGDMLTTSSFSLLSALLGFGLVGEIETGDGQKEILIPTILFLGGSIGSHSILSGRNLSARNGWRVNYVAGAGALVGLGTALAIQSENVSTYLLLPAVGGFIGWGAMLSSVSKNSRLDESIRNSFSYDLSPENYIYNQSKERTYFSPDRPGAPVVSLRFSF